MTTPGHRGEFYEEVTSEAARADQLHLKNYDDEIARLGQLVTEGAIDDNRAARLGQKALERLQLEQLRSQYDSL